MKLQKRIALCRRYRRKPPRGRLLRRRPRAGCSDNPYGPRGRVYPLRVPVTRAPPAGVRANFTYKVEAVTFQEGRVGHGRGKDTQGIGGGGRRSGGTFSRGGIRLDVARTCCERFAGNGSSWWAWVPRIGRMTDTLTLFGEETTTTQQRCPTASVRPTSKIPFLLRLAGSPTTASFRREQDVPILPERRGDHEKVHRKLQFC